MERRRKTSSSSAALVRAFIWNDDFTQVIGKTPCGRATLLVFGV
ncbi:MULTISPECIES: hypothetical protein [unclassified Nostoc]|nr:hypothetical protein [Nostoc sp. ChiQUE02]MDZ8231325.1 hypothetical protein [Nostoc sp. ChiQUE02]